MTELLADPLEATIEAFRNLAERDNLTLHPVKTGTATALQESEERRYEQFKQALKAANLKLRSH